MTKLQRSKTIYAIYLLNIILILDIFLKEEVVNRLIIKLCDRFSANIMGKAFLDLAVKQIIMTSQAGVFHDVSTYTLCRNLM